MISQPYLLVDVAHRKIQRDDLVAYQQLHSAVIFQQRDQITICLREGSDKDDEK